MKKQSKEYYKAIKNQDWEKARFLYQPDAELSPEMKKIKAETEIFMHKLKAFNNEKVNYIPEKPKHYIHNSFIIAASIVLIMIVLIIILTNWVKIII